MRGMDVETIGKKEDRKIRARRQQGRSIWYGLGMFGMVGWSVALPTVLGSMLGWWIDREWAPPFSATLSGLFGGLLTGCWIAWYWIQRESNHERNAS
ncbi:MAG: ATPase F0F1 [Planctomycetota bacterium]|nr:MAG: ATPase F0F1 [Planctomycetota bacterium]